MRMRSEADTVAEADAKGPFAVYLDMLDAHAADDVENGREPGIPVGHAFLLAPIALAVSVLEHSEILGLAIIGVMLLWVLCASAYYGRAYRRHRIAMGLPKGSVKRYLINAGLRALLFAGVYLCLKFAFRHFG